MKLSDINTFKINEAIKAPKDFQMFVDVAKKSKDANDFIKQVQKIKGVPKPTADWFFNKYNPKGGFDMVGAVKTFLKDVEKGLFENYVEEQEIILEAADAQTANEIIQLWQDKEMTRAHKLLTSLKTAKAVVIVGSIMRKLGNQEGAKFLSFLQRRGT